MMPRLVLLILILFIGEMCAQDTALIDTMRADSDMFLYYRNIGLNMDSAQTKRLYEVVYDWKGTRYQHAGHTKKGVDCSGFACEVYKNCYDTLLPGGCLNIYTMVDTISRDSLREGDLVFFKIKRGQISHVGVYLGKSFFAHASVHSGVTVSSLNEEYYRKYYFTGGRLRKSKS